MIGTYVTGALPRTQELIAKTRQYDRGKLSEKELETAYIDATKKVVEVQQIADLTYISDGMLKWQDLLRPFSIGLGGVKPGPMLRWFNNNTFFKAPIIEGDLKIHPVVSIPQISLMPKDKDWKVTLPAPYTFSILSQDDHYKNKKRLMEAYADALNQEIKSLEKLGFKYIQLNDPALVYMTTAPQKSDLPEAIKVLEIVTKGVKARTCLHTFFGDAAPLLQLAENIAVDDIGVDLYETDPNAFNGIKLIGGLALGVVNSRNSIIEDPQDLRKIIEEILQKVEIDQLFIIPNTDMDFLTFDKAEEKIQVLNRVSRSLKGI
jgi:5-methyltetrahydropteroyltriglutamate--homocysteine methyltransferase